MKKIRLSSIKRGFAKKLDFPREVVMDIPKIDISIIGDEEISIENHKEILVFKDDLIKINTNTGVLSIRGSGLEILFIGTSTIVIGGKFRSIIYGDDEK